MQEPSPKRKEKRDMKEGKTWEMNFQGLLWVTLLAELVSHPFGCKPYLLQMTWCHKALGCRGKRQSHLAANDLFLDTILPRPKPPSFSGLQQTSQLTRWSLLESPTPNQRKSLISVLFWSLFSCCLILHIMVKLTSCYLA